MFFFRFRKTTPVSGLKAGDEAIVEGKIVPKTELSLRVTGEKCVFYALTIESFRLSERGGRKLWLADQFERQGSGFFVDDGSGAKLFVPAQPSACDFRGGDELIGDIGKTGDKRYFASVFRGGDIIRLHGSLDTPSGKEPKDALVLRPPRSGVILGLRR